MRRWAVLVVVLYVLILAALAVPLVLTAFIDESLPWIVERTPRLMEGDRGTLVQAFGFMAGSTVGWWPPWAWIGVMALAEVGLLVVPVRAARGRPVTRRWIVWPIIASAFAFLVLAAACLLSIDEFIRHTDSLMLDNNLISGGGLAVLIVAGAFWLAWSLIFLFYARGQAPRTFMARLVKGLVAGSILELLVAIPAHVVARVRGYCCAGFQTFIGLAVGISVALFAFGPALFVLFLRRRQGLRPRP